MILRSPSHRSPPTRPEAFGNPLLASAALDRLTHHCHLVVIRGQSCRQRGRSKEDSATAKPPENGSELDAWLTLTST